MALHVEVDEDRAKRVSPPGLGTKFYNVDGSQSPQLWNRKAMCCKIVFMKTGLVACIVWGG